MRWVDGKGGAMWVWWAIGALAPIAACMLAAQGLRIADQRSAQRVRTKLLRVATRAPVVFEPDMVVGLPEPARRYFHWAITPGIPLSTVAEIDMTGEISLGDKTTPRYRPMCAREVLAPPHGFLWTPSIGVSLMHISGSDACAGDEAWSRFWLLGLIPAARARPTPNLVRSARARAIAESLWVPASLLPCNGAIWEPVSDEHARAIFCYRRERYSLDLVVNSDGSPRTVSMQRWTNANPEKRFQNQPFGAKVLETGAVAGYAVPTRIEAGNWFGTEAYFPFFRATVIDVRFR